MKLNDLLKENKIVAFGFPAVKDLVRFDNKDSDSTVILSTLSPTVLASHGINEYYRLELPRGKTFKNGLDIIKADINVYKYRLTILEIYPWEMKNEFVIVSRHKATVELLKKEFPYLKNAQVFQRVQVDDIKGKYVYGTLPYHLISECALYVSVNVKDFDIRDGDLKGEELKERIQIAEYPIALDFIE